MKFSVFQISRKGGREKNEDRMGYCYTRESGLFVLADGMGGHPEGEVAAQLALQTISALYQKEARPIVNDVTRIPLDLADGRAPPDHPLRQREGHARHAAHHAGGRHRAGHVGNLGALRRFAAVRGARRRAAHAHARPLLPGAAKPAPARRALDRINRNILFTCLGSPTKPVFDVTGPVTLQQGDKILLCSDGLWGSLDDIDIVRHLSTQAGVRRGARPGRGGAAQRRRAQRQRHRDRAGVGNPRRLRIHPRHLHRQHHATACSPPPSRPACSTPWSRTSTMPPSSARSPRSTKPSAARPPAKPDTRGHERICKKRRPRRRPAAPGAHHPRLHHPCRGLGADRVRQHPGAVHRLGGGKGAAAQARQRRRLGHGRVRHAAALHPHPQRPRSRPRQAKRPHPGDPAPDRPLDARGVRPQGAGRAHHPARLRRAAGRRRHPHRRDHRRVRGRAGRGEQAAGARASWPRRRSPGRWPPFRWASCRARRCSTWSTSRTWAATPT